MAGIKVMPLSERLGDDEIAELAAAMEHLGAPRLPRALDDTSLVVSEDVDDDVLAEFFDRLEAYDLACEIYLPVEFDGRVEVENLRVGSAQAVLDVLEEMKDELFADEDDEDDEDAEEDEPAADDYDAEQREILDGKVRRIWKLFHAGAKEAVERKLPLHIQS